MTIAADVLRRALADIESGGEGWVTDAALELEAPENVVAAAQRVLARVEKRTPRSFDHEANLRAAISIAETEMP